MGRAFLYGVGATGGSSSASAVDDLASVCNRTIVSLNDNRILQVPSNLLATTSTLERVDLLNCSVISTRAFYNCYNLSIVNARNVNLIYGEAFGFCSSLEEAHFGSVFFENSISVSTFRGQFSECKKLSSITFSYINMIGAEMFKNTAITIPKIKEFASEVTNLGMSAFYNNSNISGVLDLEDVFPKLSYTGFTNWSSGGGTFASTSITELYIRSSYSLSPASYYIGGSIFSNCVDLKKAYLYLQQTIGYNMFYRCSSLSFVYAPNAQTVGRAAFSTCFSLKTLIMSRLTYVQSEAFYSCSSLQRITIYFGSGNLYSTCFLGCLSLESIYLLSSSYASMSGINALTSTPISNSNYLGRFGSIFVLSSMYASYIARTNFVFYSNRIASFYGVPAEFNLINSNFTSYVFLGEQTWEEWVSSPNNTDGYYFRGSLLVRSDIGKCLPEAKISNMIYPTYYEETGYYEINASVTNGTADQDNSQAIVEDSLVRLTFYATPGYIMPDSISVTGAEYDYLHDSDKAYVDIYRPTQSVSVSIVLVEGQSTNHPVYGVRGISDSSTLLERTDDAVGLSWSRDDSTGIVSSDFDSLFPFNELTTETIDGHEMIHFPSMWFRIETAANAETLLSVAVSKTPRVDGNWFEMKDFYISKYTGYNSVAGENADAIFINGGPMTYFNRCLSMGSGYMPLDLYHDSVLKLLWLIEFADKFTYDIIPWKCNVSAFSAGITDSIAAHTGFTLDDSRVFKWHNIENFGGYRGDSPLAGYYMVSGSGSKYMTSNPAKYSGSYTDMIYCGNTNTVSSYLQLGGFNWKSSMPFMLTPKVVLNTYSSSYFRCSCFYTGNYTYAQYTSGYYITGGRRYSNATNPPVNTGISNMFGIRFSDNTGQMTVNFRFLYTSHAQGAEEDQE